MPPKPIAANGRPLPGPPPTAKALAKKNREERRRRREAQEAQERLLTATLKAAKKQLPLLKDGPLFLSVETSAASPPESHEAHTRRPRCLRVDEVSGESLAEMPDSRALLDALFSLTEKNMRLLYEESNFLGKGWSDRAKRDELGSDDAVFWVVSLHSDEKDSDAQSQAASAEEGEKKKEIKSPSFSAATAARRLVAFLHFRFEVEEGVPLVYLYELQTQEGFRSCGLGRQLVQRLETETVNLNHALAVLPHPSSGSKAAASSPPLQLRKIVCTVLRSNERAMAFYKNKCGFVSDETCPWKIWNQDRTSQEAPLGEEEDEEDSPPEYEILSKEIAFQSPPQTQL